MVSVSNEATMVLNYTDNLPLDTTGCRYDVADERRCLLLVHYCCPGKPPGFTGMNWRGAREGWRKLRSPAMCRSMPECVHGSNVILCTLLLVVTALRRHAFERYMTGNTGVVIFVEYSNGHVESCGHKKQHPI